MITSYSPIVGFINKCFFCVNMAIAFSQTLLSQDMAFKIFTAKDGMPSNYVFTTYADKLGYVWVCTPEGIGRFNGNSFTNYGLQDGLPDLRVLCGFMDSKKRFWIGTGRGIAEFKGNGFISYPYSDSPTITWVYNFIETRQGYLWALTSFGVYQFENDKWIKVKLFPGYEQGHCRNIVETEDGMYINYGDRLVLKSNDKYTVLGKPREEGYYYNQLLLAGSQILISTPDGLFEIKNLQLLPLPLPTGKQKGLYVSFCDSKKRLWIANAEEGIFFTERNSSEIHKIEFEKPAIFLPQSFSEDSEGNIWLSCGSMLVRFSALGFQQYNLSAQGDNSVYNMFQPPSESLIINNGTKTLLEFNHGVITNKPLRLTDLENISGTPLIIDHYAFDNKGRKWYCLRGWQLAMQMGNTLYGQNKYFKHLKPYALDVIFDEFRKKILVVIGDQPLPCQVDDTVYRPMNTSNKIDIRGPLRIVHQAVNGTILFSTSEGKIYSIDKKDNCMLQLNEFNSRGSVVKMTNDLLTGDVWVLYRGRGLRRYSWQNDKLIFTEEIIKGKGLLHDNVTTVLFDNNHNLWVGTNFNVAVFVRKKQPNKQDRFHIAKIFNADVLNTEGSVESNLTKDNDGNIWYYSGKTMICFQPSKISYVSTPPKIQVENIELNLLQANWQNYADSLTGIFQLPYNLKLSYKDNTIGFNFKAILTSGTEGRKYSYQLEGLNNNWSLPTTNDFVSFAKIPPGKYSFRVKAQLPGTEWSTPVEFAFEIKKAYWQTWWFYFLVAAVFSAAIFMLFRYRLNQKMKMMEMRNRISQDLHDEIGSSISGINLLTQIAAEKIKLNQPDEASDYLLKVKNYTQDVIEKLADMVWIFNPQNDSIEKLIQRLKSFSIIIASSKNIQVHFKTVKENGLENLTIRQRKAIYLISKEAINNSLKYSEGSNMFYILDSKESEWMLEVNDDGKGFEYSEMLEGNGLRNMKARAAEINAKLNIESNPGKGTRITLRIT